MGKAKAKRKPGAPEFAVMPKRKRRGAKIERDEVRMARIRAVLARTASARAAIDAAIEGVDTSDIDHLPVVEFPRGRPKPPGMRRVASKDEDDDTEEIDDDVLLHYTKPRIAPPVPFVPELERSAGILNAGEGRVRKPISCSACGSTEHRRHQCPEHPLHGQVDDTNAIVLTVDTIDKLETIRMAMGSQTFEDVIVTLCLTMQPAPAAPPPTPDATDEAAPIVRCCKACRRPRCRSDSRFCPKNPAYDPSCDTRLDGAGGALRDLVVPEPSTPAENPEPSAPLASSFFGNTLPLVVWASSDLLEAFHAYAATVHPDAQDPSALVLREYMVKMAFQPEPGHAVPKKRGPYMCSKCRAAGHRADSRKCPLFTAPGRAAESVAA